jgi:hypothetical protein
MAASPGCEKGVATPSCDARLSERRGSGRNPGGAALRRFAAMTDHNARAVLRGPGEVAEDEAGDAVVALYARLRELLDIAFVPTVFRMLAVHERYLAAVVDALAATSARRRAAHARACVEFAVRVAAELDPPALDAGTDAPRVAALLDRYNVANPSGLLVLTALAMGLEPARGVLEPPLPSRAGRSLDDDVLACHGGFTVPGLWRELGHGWPALAERAWNQIRALAEAPRFGTGRTELVALAAGAIGPGELPRPAAVLTGRDAAEVEPIVAWFACAIPTMVLEIECLRLALNRGSG